MRCPYQLRTEMVCWRIPMAKACPSYGEYSLHRPNDIVLDNVRRATITGADIKCLLLSILKDDNDYKPVNMEYMLPIHHIYLYSLMITNVRHIVQQISFQSSSDEIVNPAHADPREFEVRVTMEKSSTWTLFRKGIATLCVTYGFMLDSYLREGKSAVSGKADKYFKGILFLIVACLGQLLTDCQHERQVRLEQKRQASDEIEK